MILAFLATSAAACGRDIDAAPSASDVRSTASPAPERWLAAVELAPLADDLDAPTERLIGPLGEALVVSPVDCFEGLPADVDDGYVIGAVGDSKDEVEGLILDAGEQVLFSASVTILCTD